METGLATHTGAWTEADLAELPETCQRFELLDGRLQVNPPAGGVHQAVSLRMASLLHVAAPPDLLVVEAFGVRMRDNTLFIPDIVVAARPVVLANRSGILDASDVALIVEIVSPGSRTMDRITKPVLYAEAGIPSFWRIELDGPTVFVSRLEGDRYVEAGRARPGEPFSVAQPFPLILDPAKLQP